ncbi:MAG: VWA domain-containing protein, partial [Alphaproteobacteria bacterium]|nr:VWA domain-containing protein [Alphaproteobacteria bacterium]
MIELAFPWFLLLLPLPLLIRRYMSAVSGRRGGALKVYFFNEIVGLPHGVMSKTNRGRWRMITMLFVWAGLLFAASRPRWIGSPEEVETMGRDLMLAVDISGSMSIPDFKLNSNPTDRLTVVKKVANEFISRREGDRLGLILFGTRAFHVCPLTYDRATVQQILKDSEIGLAGMDTAIGDTIGLAAKRFRDRPLRSRVLILLTDGHNTTGNIEPVQALMLAKAMRMRIFTIGVA